MPPRHQRKPAGLATSKAGKDNLETDIVRISLHTTALPHDLETSCPSQNYYPRPVLVRHGRPLCAGTLSSNRPPTHGAKPNDMASYHVPVQVPASEQLPSSTNCYKILYPAPRTSWQPCTIPSGMLYRYRSGTSKRHRVHRIWQCSRSCSASDIAWTSLCPWASRHLSLDEGCHRLPLLAHVPSNSWRSQFEIGQHVHSDMKTSFMSVYKLVLYTIGIFLGSDLSFMAFLRAWLGTRSVLLILFQPSQDCTLSLPGTWP